MSMKPEFFCCIGAELKDEIAGSLKSSRIFMYRAAESQTISDMLVDGFFNEADDLRVNDLILLYCPEKTRAFTYAKVSSVAGGVVKTTTVNIDPQDILIDTTGYSNISGSNLKQVLDSIDAEFSKYVKKDGSSIMTGPLKFIAGSYSGAIAGGLGDGIEIYKINSSGTIQTEVASLTLTNGFIPGSTNTISVGSNALKWKNLYLAGTAYITKINNGFDIAVPVTNSADTLALKSQVDLAANSGSQLYSTGVWYAKMYAATVVPTGAEYDGRNYADFSQVDSDNNPVIKIYTGASGAWTLTETITPPANYNGYITVTSKIWDILEQSGQQGGKVLWDYVHKTFTPYPQIISFESINITGNSTVVMPASPTNNNIVNKGYVDNAVSSSIFPVGGIIPFGGSTAPAGWLLCDGSTVLQSTYSNLFAVIGGAYSNGIYAWDVSGTKYYTNVDAADLQVGDTIYDGNGDPYDTVASSSGSTMTGDLGDTFTRDSGSDKTTFNLPNYSDCFVQGGTPGTTHSAGLPNITGWGQLNDDIAFQNAGGALYLSNSYARDVASNRSGSQNHNINLDASRSSSIYGNSNTVQPKSVESKFIIKY